MSGLVGRGSGGHGHNKREQSALIGVCWDRRASYESRAGQCVTLELGAGSINGPDQ